MTRTMTSIDLKEKVNKRLYMRYLSLYATAPRKTKIGSIAYYDLRRLMLICPYRP
jgi:hypothetical protein